MIAEQIQALVPPITGTDHDAWETAARAAAGAIASVRHWRGGKERVTAAESRVLRPAVVEHPASAATGAYAEGILAGLVGAATIAVWFFALDSISGRPFYTPTVLGTALFRGGVGLENPQALAPDFEMILSFTWVHVLAFLLIGVAASRLLGLVELDPSFGFGVVLLFVFFESGFVLANMVFAEPVLGALTWPAVLAGNLLAAAAMAAVFWRRHPRLAIRP